jgi:hypothetical protein
MEISIKFIIGYRINGANVIRYFGYASDELIGASRLGRSRYHSKG